MKLKFLCDVRHWELGCYFSPLFLRVSLLFLIWEIFPAGSEACS
jgi:hypothetical protein